MIIKVIQTPGKPGRVAAEAMAAEMGEGTKYYVLTDIPFGKKAEKESAKKLKHFKDAGYATLEIGKDPADIWEWVQARRRADMMLIAAKGESGGDEKPALETVILDNLPVMTVNVLFNADEEGGKPMDTSYAPSDTKIKALTEKLMEGIKELGDKVNLIVVTEEPQRAPVFGAGAESALKAIALANQELDKL